MYIYIYIYYIYYIYIKQSKTESLRGFRTKNIYQLKMRKYLEVKKNIKVKNQYNLDY